MNSIIKLVLIFSLFYGASSCTERFLPTALEPPDVDDLIVAQSFFSDRDSIIYASITVALNPFERHDTLGGLIDAAELIGDEQFTVQLLRNEIYEGNYNFIPDPKALGLRDRINFSIPSPPINPNDQFEIVVSHPEYGTVSAYQSVPEFVPIQRIEYLGIVGSSGIESFGNTYLPLHGIRIEIADPAEEENYYQISIADFFSQIDSTTNAPSSRSGSFHIESNNTELIGLSKSFVNNTFYLSDKNFNGQSFSFIIMTTGELNPETRIMWRNISKAWYRYVISIINQSPESEFFRSSSLLSGYFQVTSQETNIIGGLGCFGASTEARYEIIQ